MSEETKVLKAKAEKAKALYRSGIVSKEQAKEEILPYISLVNVKSKEIAKKYNQKPRLVSVEKFLRQ